MYILCSHCLRPILSCYQQHPLFNKNSKASPKFPYTEILLIYRLQIQGCTGSCHFQCNHWWKFHQMATHPLKCMMTSWNGNFFSRYWPFVRGIQRSLVNSPHKGQWRGGLMFSLICVWINAWVNNREAGDLRHYRAHYDVTVMTSVEVIVFTPQWLLGYLLHKMPVMRSFRIFFVVNTNRLFNKQST